MGFNDAHLFAQHINSLHLLPVFGPEYQPKAATAETAFNGVLHTSITVINVACRYLESAQPKIWNCNANRATAGPGTAEGNSFL